MTTADTKAGLGKDIVVYVCILILAAIQFVIAYQNLDGSTMFVWMLIVACIEAALGLLFFMHLSENRGLLWFVVIFAVFALLAMQYGWTDSFRIVHGAPWSR
ncbi:MAG: cytochrome C oxidase subunit IV family protein [Terriglobales bacterium]|jgi:heme/copper-type cytochrome/quinol oxidase subunit 4